MNGAGPLCPEGRKKLTRHFINLLILGCFIIFVVGYANIAVTPVSYTHLVTNNTPDLPCLFSVTGENIRTFCASAIVISPIIQYNTDKYNIIL